MKNRMWPLALTLCLFTPMAAADNNSIPVYDCNSIPDIVITPSSGAAALQSAINAVASIPLSDALIWIEASDTHNYGSIVIPSGVNNLTIMKAIECPLNPLPVIMDGAQLTGVPGISIEGGATVHLEGLTVQNFNTLGTSLGGGLDAQAGADFTVKSCIFQNNSADSGGGARTNFATACFVACLFQNNSTNFSGTASGGGAYLFESPAIIDACTFNNNQSGRAGGGLTCAGNLMGGSLNDVLIQDSFFINNLTGAGASGGGGLRGLGLGTMRVNRTVFTGNEAGRGGGLSFEIGRLVVDYCEFNQNLANEEGGGGLSYQLSNNVLISNSLFEANDSQGVLLGGGAIMAVDDPFFGSGPPTRIENCLIIDNTSSTSGGGLYLGQADDSSDVSVEILFCTIDGNHADERGGGIANENLGSLGYLGYGGELDVTDTILFENTANEQIGNPSLPPSVGDQQVYGSAGAVMGSTFEFCFWDQDQTATRFSCETSCIDTIANPMPGYDPNPMAVAIAHQPNEDFYLEHDGTAAACVDQGNPTSNAGGTTEDDQSVDLGLPDIGFHYGAPPLPIRITRIVADGSVIPAGGGSVTFSIDAGAYDPASGGPLGEQYIVFVASLTGTAPGVALGPNGTGPFLPLVFDSFYLLKINQPLSIYSPRRAYFPDDKLDGVLDGKVDVTLTLDASQVATLKMAGADFMWHAACVWDWPAGFGNTAPGMEPSFLAPSGAIRTDIAP